MRGASFASFREVIPFYESPGGMTIGLFRNSADEHRFIETVRYDTNEACQRDQQRVAYDPAMSAYLVRWRELLAEPPVVETYRVMSP